VILRGKKKARRINFPDFKLSYKAINPVFMRSKGSENLSALHSITLLGLKSGFLDLKGK